ncbi:uncharacterized protein [Rutidosis leptorrhynchoides]|uniref:uncharacterized protein n=1 Tax=Rutidosis leptorrhynchoides TaxID=125765 RepID=UPI003A98CEA1
MSIARANKSSTTASHDTNNGIMAIQQVGHRHYRSYYCMLSDNGTQFEGEPFKSWCQELNIKQSFTSVAHPQANGQCEVINRDIVKGIKARPGLYGNEWVDELPSVLWVHRTTHKNSTGETSFSLVYGTEAVIPQN